MALSDRVSAHVADQTYAGLPEATRSAAKRALLDATGVMIAASGLSPDVAPFIELARKTGGHGKCTLFGYPDRLQPVAAALAGGAMAHALDFEDVFDRAPCHPNASAIPALIALTQSERGIEGRELVTAIAVGCDLVCRLALSLRRPLEAGGWYPPTLLGGFGAAAATARLLGLNAGQVRDALSLALCQVTAPAEIRNSAQTVLRAVREAFPAQAAVVSALLARSGVAGFEEPLEGADAFYELYADGKYDARELLDGLGERFLIEELSFKPWPTCRGTHACVQIALDLMRQHQFGSTAIAEIVVEAGEVQRMLIEPIDRKRAPRTLVDARFSIPFTVAMAFSRGEVRPESFEPAVLTDANIRQLAARVTPVFNPQWGNQHATRGSLRVRLHDGREYAGQVEHPHGSPQAPLSDAELTKKFIHCCSVAANPIGEPRARAAAARILAIDAEADAGSCFDLWELNGD